jgi:tetratricopeptide (TPR) repeat protein
MLRLSYVVVCVSLLLAGTVRADEAANQARIHYQNGNKAFAVGDFAAAADEYELAYKGRPDAALLFNAAQARRLAGDNQKALTLYRNYVGFYPKSKNVADVKDQIVKLQEAIAAAEKAKTAAPTNTVEMSKQEQHPQPEPQKEVQKEPEKPVPVYKKWWLWTAVAGGVVIIALAIALPLALQTPWANLPNQGPGAGLTFAPAAVPTAHTARLLEVRW